MKNSIPMDPPICNGRSVVNGTCIAVKTVMEFHVAGDSADEVLEEYQALTRQDVLACMDWAARLMANDFQIATLA